MHEMLNEGNTEKTLKKGCIQVGKHLYVKPGSEIDVTQISAEEKNNFQVVFSMGGSGSRLKHITEDKYSKHLIQINGKPISRHVVDLWTANGFTDVAILTDNTHRGKSVMDYYNSDGFGAEINFSIEYKKLASGGAIRQAIANGVITKSFINHYPDDAIVNYPEFASDFANVVAAAFKEGFQSVVLCAPGKLYPFGVVEDKNGRVSRFVEKPFISMDSNTGIFAIRKDAFPLILALEADTEIKIERTVLSQIAESGKMLKVLIPTEHWLPVNDENHLKRLSEIIGTEK